MTPEPETRTIDEMLDWITGLYPYQIRVEVYTDVDAGWDVYVHWDGGYEHDCRETMHEALASIVRQIDARLASGSHP